MLLTLDGVSRVFGGLKALDGVSFQVEQGAVHGLIGPNGAGKTTLINVLSGLTAPSAGTINFNGTFIHEMPPHEVAALGVARTFQNIRLFPTMTCLENVMAGQHLVSRRSLVSLLLMRRSVREENRALRRGALETLERVGLAARAHTLAHSLSYGERRRLEIARGLAAFPRLLLLDEPVAGMRTGEAEQVAGLIRSIAAEGVTVLLIEHNMRFVMGLCSRVTVLNFGQVIATGTPNEVSEHPGVIEAYLGAADDD